jgi:hypothetical protein
MTPRVVLLGGLLAGLAGCSDPKPKIQPPTERPSSAASTQSAAPRSVTSAAPATMPPLEGKGWQRVTPLRPRSLRQTVWDTQKKRLLALDAVGVHAWNGTQWRLLTTVEEPSQHWLVAHPEGARLLRVNDGTLWVRTLTGEAIGPPRKLPAEPLHGRLMVRWHPQRKGVVLHFSFAEQRPDTPRSETWFDDGARLTRLTKRGPYLMGLGWRDNQLVGFEDRRVWRLDGTTWRPDPERLPGLARAVAPNGDLWMFKDGRLARLGRSKPVLDLPGTFYTAPYAFDPVHHQILTGLSHGEGAGQIWVSTQHKPFEALKNGPWWRPADEAQGLVSTPKRLVHLHGPTGAVSRLTAKGWQVEKDVAPKPDPEWPTIFQYGHWGDSLVRLDMSGALWRSGPWRAVETDGRGPRIGQRDHSVALLGVGTRLITHDEDDGATWALENGRWRELSRAPERAATPSLVSTPKGAFLLTGQRLWRLDKDAWTLVHHHAAWGGKRMAFDAEKSALLSVGWRAGVDGMALAVFEKGAWRTLAPLPDTTDSFEFGVDARLRRAVLMNENGEGWMIDLDQLGYTGGLP